MKLLYTSLFILLANISIFGQNFAPLNATWHYTEYFNNSGNIDYILLEAVKDTTINDTICRKITKRHQLFANFRPQNDYIAEINNKVFFFDPVFNHFQILYDFDAQVGDYWDIKVRLNPTNQHDMVRVKIDSIKTTTINNAEIKKRYVSYFRLSQANEPDKYLHSQIFDKIGDISYMFYWYYLTTDYIDFYSGNYSQGLRCYKDDELGLYQHNSQYPCDYANVGINETASSNFRIYPNPVKDIVKIEGINPNIKNLSVRLYDVTGNTLLSKEFCTEIDMRPYNSGIYFISITDSLGDVSIVKFIKK